MFIDGSLYPASPLKRDLRVTPTSNKYPASLCPANSICFSSTRRFEAKLRYNVLYLSILANSVNSLLIPLNSTSIHKQPESTVFFNLNNLILAG